jgi:hypothetical protein
MQFTAFWAGGASNPRNVLYVAGAQDSQVRGYQMTTNGGGTFNTSTPFGYAPAPNPLNGKMAYPGSSPVVTWNANGGKDIDAILWILDTSGTPVKNPVAKIYAYQAVPQTGNQLTLKWSDTLNGPSPTKFMVPTVVNGYLYLAGQKPGAACNPGSCLGRVVSWH